MKMKSESETRTETEIQRAIEVARRRAAQGEVVILVVPPAEEEDEPKFDRSWKEEFFKWRRRGRSVRVAAELAGVTERHVYRTYKKDPEFARTWDLTKRSCEEVSEVSVEGT